MGEASCLRQASEMPSYLVLPLFAMDAVLCRR